MPILLFILCQNKYMPTFRHEHYAMLVKNNPEEAKKYIASFNNRKNAEEKDRAYMADFLKKHWVRVFSNYKYETVKKKYNSLREELKQASLSTS